jgi:hypothetical protein
MKFGRTLRTLRLDGDSLVLTCVCCDKIILFTKHQSDLRAPMEKQNDLFRPTVCFSCEEVCRASTAAVWMPLQISHRMLQLWDPFVAMNTFLCETIGPIKRLLIEDSIVHRDEVRDWTGSIYRIQSVKPSREAGVSAEPEPYLESGFF